MGDFVELEWLLTFLQFLFFNQFLLSDFQISPLVSKYPFNPFIN